MRTEYKKIKEGEFLDSIYKRIPSNVILHKTLCGIGATSLELSPESQRNSIICEPNVPVIEGKCRDKNGRKRKDIIGVTADVDIQDVYDYVANASIRFKKILVTPESFHKVLKAAEALGIDIYSEYFMMFDECERATKDSEYRETITLPMNDFFKFKEKAFVSATTLEMSDPRFEAQGFKKIIIKPDYDFAIRAELICTNNVYETFSRFLNRLTNETERVFVFFNSAKGIAALVKKTHGLQEVSAVFCSKNAKEELIASNLKNVHTKFDAGKAKRINFLTSRFNSAMDIDLKYKPHVVILANMGIAPHSIVDPQTDGIQIVGRFRKGRKSVTIISDTDAELVLMNKDERYDFLVQQKKLFQMTKNLVLISQNQIFRNVYLETLNALPYKQYVYEDGSLNHYMVDNFHYQEEIKGYYTSPERLVAAYNVPGYGMYHWKVNSSLEDYSISDRVISVKNVIRKHEERVKSVIEKRRSIIESLVANPYEIPHPSEKALKELQLQFPLIMRAIQIIGEEETLKHRHSERMLSSAIGRHQRKFIGNNFDFLKDLYGAIPEQSQKEYNATMRAFKKIIDKYGLPYKANQPDFKGFFSYKIVQPRTTNGTRPRQIVILKHKYSVE